MFGMVLTLDSPPLLFPFSRGCGIPGLEPEELGEADAETATEAKIEASNPHNRGLSPKKGLVVKE